jgi:hypothetical protein
MIAGLEVELWVREYQVETLRDIKAMQDEEDDLNDYYLGEWAKQGWTRDRKRIKRDESTGSS